MKVGFVSDIHEDIVALREAFAILASYGCEEFVCLGDLVGYSVPWYQFLKSRSARDVIALVREKCKTILVGNHDLYAVKKLPEYKAGFDYPENWYGIDYWERKKRAQNKLFLYENEELSALLSEENNRFIMGLPEYVIRDFGGVKSMLSHYAYPDLTGSTTFSPKSSSEARPHFDFMEKAGCAIGFSGHWHTGGAALFTADKVIPLPFGKIKINAKGVAWLHGPPVVRAGIANGVMTFDTETFEVEIIPLSGSSHHLPQAAV